MAILKKKSGNPDYISARESRRISRENRRITDRIERMRSRTNVPPEEYVTTMRDPNNVAEFDNLHTYFFTDIGVVKAVDGVTFDVPKGKTVGVVGESGCGKSVTSLALMQLVQRPQGQIVEGTVRFNAGDVAYDIAKTPAEAMQRIRGNHVSMIFQEPMTSLNPVFRAGAQIDEVVKLHNPGMTEDKVRARTLEMLDMVNIADSSGVYRMYPHELSGGMRQRVMIAMALSCDPRLIIADEPTTALDVTIQAQILELLKKLKKKYDLTIIFITHDLGVVANIADRVAVMYAGDIVEIGLANEVYYDPRHPYTWALLSSLPQLGVKGQDLYSIKGTPPNLFMELSGDAFAARNPSALAIDFVERPPYFDITETHKARTWLLDPRAPKVEPPVHIQNLRTQHKGGERGGR
jgi:peptide/nickel transport system ATP-binding protein